MNDKFINESALTLKCNENTRLDPCLRSPHIKFFLTSEIVRPYVFLTGTHAASSKIVLKQVVNVCSLLRDPGLNIFVRVVYEALKENINFDLHCPLKKVYHDYIF